MVQSRSAIDLLQSKLEQPATENAITMLRLDYDPDVNEPYRELSSELDRARGTCSGYITQFTTVLIYTPLVAK